MSHDHVGKKEKCCDSEKYDVINSKEIDNASLVRMHNDADKSTSKTYSAFVGVVKKNYVNLGGIEK